MRENVFKYMIIVGFSLSFLIPFIINAFHLEIKWSFRLSLVNGAVYYAVVGYILNKKIISTKWELVIYFFDAIGMI